MVNPKIYILISTYKRPEYLPQCLDSLYDAQEYGSNVKFILMDDGSPDKETEEALNNCKLNKQVIIYKENMGLRNRIIDFFDIVRKDKPDYIGILGNDVIMPKDWLKIMLEVHNTTDVDILSPNYLPSNPAFTLGQPDTDNKGYRRAYTVGVWLMKKEMIDDLYFDRTDLRGIKGSIQIIHQIKVDKTPNIGFTTKVVGNDIGHHSGLATEHIKSEEHREYSNEVGREVTW